jgi:phosphoribosyl 1,2-cyclic phosphodiesterase
MRFSVLASGSDGNCTFIDSETKVLIDAGISYKRISKELDVLGFDIAEIDAVFITHEHDDHVKGLQTLKKKTEIPIYLNQETFDQLGLGRTSENFISGRVKLNGMSLEPVSVSHDAANPVAFVVEDKERKLGVMTDLGHVTDNIREKVGELDSLVIESNHDIDMLLHGTYPYSLKQRIIGPQGHLSNFDSSLLVRDHSSERLRSVVLAHLSKNNNTPDLALDTFKKINKSQKVSVSQNQPTELTLV